jgi:hypothetical protein
MLFIKVDEYNYVISVFNDYGSLSTQLKSDIGDGYFVETLPTIERQFGKAGRLKYNLDQGVVEAIYEDRPLTPEEEIITLKRQNDEMAIALASLLGM